jgi:putative transposase
MQRLRAFKYRIYPTHEQEQYLAHAFGCKRFIYNHFLAINLELLNAGQYTLSAFSVNKEITLLKKEHEFLKDVDDWVLKNASADLATAFKNYFDSCSGKRKGKKVQKPKFKKKSSRNSFRTRPSNIGSGVRLDETNQLLKIPKLKTGIKIKLHQQITGPIKSVTISKTPSGKYFASILVEEIYLPEPMAYKNIGIDLGLRDLVITSDGQKFSHPKHLIAKTTQLLKQQQKILARKKKGSKNYEKQRIKVARLYEQITNIKRNYYHNLSNYLVKTNDVIIMEDLNIEGMKKCKKISRAIHESSWYLLMEMIRYKSDWHCRTFHQIDRWYPSSKTCSSCGHKLEFLGRGISHWVCPVCGDEHDRDINAAVNILNEGLKDLCIPKQQGNWSGVMCPVPLVLQKLTSKM